MRFPLRPLLLAAILAAPVWLSGAVIGKNPLSQPLSTERIAGLPAEQRTAWETYWKNSEKLRAADEAALAAEMKTAGLTAPLVPLKGKGVSLMNPPAWWAEPEAARMADIVVSFQTAAGGWNKNTDLTKAPRRLGERSGYEAGYVGTIDNDATISQLRFLARTITAVGPTAPATARWRESLARGFDYLLAAQYPNGGWPQVFPLEGSYHDAVTLNDGAMTNVLTLLRDVADGAEEFAFASQEWRTRASAAEARGLDCLLKAQIAVNGKRTIWCQQYDTLTLAPCAARNYEMPSQSSGESAGVMKFLMDLPNPSAEVVAAVHAAAAWFPKTALRDVVFKFEPDGSGRALQPSPGAGPIWPRYSEIGTDRPIFGDRDLTIHDNVAEISKERRNGYAWFGDSPKRVLDHYAKWAKKNPIKG